MDAVVPVDGTVELSCDTGVADCLIASPPNMDLDVVEFVIPPPNKEELLVLCPLFTALPLSTAELID